MKLGRHMLVVLAVAGGGLLASPVRAQPAEALGHPLPEPGLPTGTVTVLVVAGDISSAVPGIDVKVRINGNEYTARTNAEGRATFNKLAVGASVQAVIVGDSGEVLSDQFPVPKDGGTRLLLSTKPFTGGGMGGAAGMPEPRVVSGHARPESADPAGMLTVRLTYDDFSDPKPPANQTVMLVGYRDDDSVTVKRVQSDPAGRAEFSGLDVSGRTAYYAMALLPRGAGVDRVMSSPIQMLPGVGLRVALSAAKRTSTEAPIDDLGRLDTQLPNVPADTIAVAVVTDRHDDGGTADLVDATTGKVLASTRFAAAADAGKNTNGRFGPFEPDAKTPVGTLKIVMAGPDGGPLPEATVSLIPAEGTGQAMPPQSTDANGKATFTGVAAGSWIVGVENEDAKAQSDPVTIPADSGGRVVGVLSWFDGIPPRLVPLKSPTTTDPVYVQLRVKGALRKSLPFQTVPDHGTTTPFGLGDRLRFAFVLDGSVDDKYLGFQGRITIMNSSWAPYRAGDDGLVIPLPSGFTGGVVGEEDKKTVAPEPYAGFRIRRPLPPGQYTFDAGFSLPIDTDGLASWHLDLPWGAIDSRIAVLHSPGMKVNLPDGATGKDVESKSGVQFFLIDDIEIPAGHSMAMSIGGLPVAPAWKLWFPRAAGVVVLVMLCLTVWITLRARRTAAAAGHAANAARIQALLDELVELERKGQAGRRKEAILSELETLWDTAGQRPRAA